MKKALKELLENAEEKRVGHFHNLLIVSNGVYDGFWGKNGYNNIILLGYVASDTKYYKITESADIFNIFDLGRNNFRTLNIDIPTEYGVPRIWFNKPIFIDYSAPISGVVGE